LEELDVVEMTILKWISRKSGGRVWAGFMWFRIGTCGSPLWTLQWNISFQRGGEFLSSATSGFSRRPLLHGVSWWNLSGYNGLTMWLQWCRQWVVYSLNICGETYWETRRWEGDKIKINLRMGCGLNWLRIVLNGGFWRYQTLSSVFTDITYFRNIETSFVSPFGKATFRKLMYLAIRPLSFQRFVQC
jgi:hypothetical protein